MTRTEVVRKLRDRVGAIRGLGATSLYLFGARNEASSRSDLDLFVDYDPESRFSLIELVGIKQLLEEELGVDVDVTTRDSLLRDDIERSAVRIV